MFSITYGLSNTIYLAFSMLLICVSGYSMRDKAKAAGADIAEAVMRCVAEI